MDARDIKLLVIEDEPYVRDSYVDMLDILGFKCDVADNGREGLAKIAKTDYHIVLTDLNMPVMDGLETLKRIKKKTPHVQVIVITGFATIENAIKAMKQGAFDYITKPISFEHVKIILDRCVQHIIATQENKELKDHNQELLELNDLKSKFITITNHELRTPLAVIKGYVELLEMAVPEKNEETREYFEVVNNTLHDLVEMVERMHDLSHVDSALQKFSTTTFNLNLEALSVANEMKLLFRRRSVGLNISANTKEIFVEADKNALRRAIRELLQNALKFTDKDGQVSLEIKKETSDNRVYLSVKDNGIGIPPDKLDMIFEPFYEVQDVMHHSTSQTEFMGGGIGVGLSIVKEIVEANKGEVAVSSKPGKGSTFTIIMPAAEVMQSV